MNKSRYHQINILKNYYFNNENTKKKLFMCCDTGKTNIEVIKYYINNDVKLFIYKPPRLIISKL